MPKNYQSYSKDELIRELNKLKKRKKYGLAWEDKPEDVVELCKTKLPVLKEVKSKEIITDKDKPVNILIEGDNYHALSVLNYTHNQKIDVIYIDPPYNTGAKDWKYNNNFVDVNDQWRHSKWLSMMEKRLVLAKHLLKPTGIILIAIDDHEIHRLRFIVDEIMGENNYVATICIEVNPAGQNIRESSPAISHDYCLIYARAIDQVTLIPRTLSEEETTFFKENDGNGNFIWDNLRRRGGNSTPKDRPGQWYPLYCNIKTKELSLKKFKGSIEIWPIDPKGAKRIWRVNPDGFSREYAAGNISIIQKAGRIEISKKSYEPKGRKPKTLWKDARHSATSHGTKLLMDILGSNSFSYPKSLYLVQDCIKYWAGSNSVILDFFAGSGTTGHAVLDLNKEDGGNRQFILCTNNENNICTDVCYPRIEKVITGYKNSSGEKIEGLGGNLKYFRTDFVDAQPTDRNKVKLTNQAIEMLCIREGTFESVIDKNDFKVFKNGSHHTGIILDQLAIPQFKKAISAIGGPASGGKVTFSVYVFSLGDDTFDEEFDDLRQRIKLSPIPEAILRVYRRIFK